MLHDKLFGLRFTVTQDGTLRFSGSAYLYPRKTSYIPYIDIPIPAHILAQGTDIVRAYATSEAERELETIAAQELTAHEERMKRLRELNVRIATKHGGIYLKGSIRLSNRPGFAVWDVFLEGPQKYARPYTIYHSRYNRESLVVDARPSLSALLKAHRALVLLYTQMKHEEQYPTVYEILHKLS